MNRLFLLMTVGAAVLSMAGCARITSQVVEKPRVDQQLEQGNRGYLAGTAPPASERTGTRQMIQTDVELPTANELNPWKLKRSAPGSASVQAPSSRVIPAARSIEPEPAEEENRDEMEIPPVRTSARSAPVSREGASAYTTYTVQKGDNLEKIAAKVYGNGNKWRRIYKANQDHLKSPNKIYVGQKLKIPPVEKEEAAPIYSSDTLK